MSSNLIIDTIISGGVSRGLEVPDYWRNENRDPVYDSAYCYRQRSMVARIRHHTPVLQHPASRMEQRLGRAKAEVKPMWDIPFDESMLTAKPGVAIFCPEEALAEELFGILKRNDISWPHSSPRWSNYGESTVYCVSGSRVKFGTKDAVNRINPYCNYIKCTFYGIDTPDFDVASDDELRALFGIGGG